MSAPVKDLKISELIPSFLSDCDMKKLSTSTYNRVLLLFVKWLYVNRLTITSIGRSHIIAWKKSLEESHKPRTVNLYLSVIKRFYAWMNENGHYSDVAKGIKFSRVIHKYTRLPLTVDQVGKLLSIIDRSTAKSRRDHAMINLMVKTGLRRVEVTRLNVSDIIERNGKPALVIQRKGHDSKDVNKIITPQLLDELNEMICDRPEVDQSQPLFISYDSAGKHNRLTTDRISRLIKAYLKQIGLNDPMYSAHSLRHTTAVTLLDAGYDLYYVQMFMGHSSPATTQLYTKLISDRLNLDDKGVNSLESVFKIKG